MPDVDDGIVLRGEEERGPIEVTECCEEEALGVQNGGTDARRSAAEESTSGVRVACDSEQYTLLVCGGCVVSTNAFVLTIVLVLGVSQLVLPNHTSATSDQTYAGNGCQPPFSLGYESDISFNAGFVQNISATYDRGLWCPVLRTDPTSVSGLGTSEVRVYDGDDAAYVWCAMYSYDAGGSILRSEFELTSSGYVGSSTLQFTTMNLSDNLGGHYSLYCSLPDHDVSYSKVYSYRVREN